MTALSPSTTVRLRHIFLVEDNQDHLALTLEALEEAAVGNPVRTAATVQEAKDAIAEWTEQASVGQDALPCVVLLDVRLPDGSGLEVLRELKANGFCRAIPVVILTSSEETPDIRRAYQLGANSYLVKPVVPDEFNRKIREAGLYWALLNRACEP
jgi:two-component system response regulator